MAKPKIHTTTDFALNQISLLEKYVLSMNTIEVKFQYFISELVMLRLFAIVETSIAEIAYKLATGATYLNGNPPKLLVSPCVSIKAAKHNMRTLNRRTTTDLHWRKASDIKDNIKHLLDSSDYFAQNIDKYGSIFSEMRIVRTYIAHRNTGSRKKFKSVIRQIYGANLRLQVGAFLISKKRKPMANLEKYIKTSRIFLNDIAIGK